MTRRIFLCLAFASLVILGCARQSAIPLGADVLASGATYYVQNHGKDKRGLEVIIASTLREAGLDVTSGPAGSRPESAIFLVTYVDNWSWDMRTYMLQMHITVTDTRSGAVVADSTKYQDSLAAMGTSYEAIVRETTLQLLEGAQ